MILPLPTTKNEMVVASVLKKKYLSFSLVVCLSLLLGCTKPEQLPDFYPQVLDDRLTLELIATTPTIMTPIGLAIDSHDDLYVLESNTHSPPSDYTGPKYDRIKKGVDVNKDGSPESWVIYADSINDGMNLTFGQDDILYMVEKDSVIAFQDTNGDGVSDQRKVLLQLWASGNVYEHAALLGITYSPDGWLYISRGNTGGLAWQLEGTDGSTVQGYGDGGNVMRCRPDGTQLQEIATGFWNPFDLKFTWEGRLMLVDNDPDSRGPNRLLEIVYGGDYGYQSLYGGSGIHPFLAWNGELPGTLPYAAALGEAPSGLIDASYSNFPSEYAGNILATVWEENCLVRIPLQPYLSSVQGATQRLLQGDSTFHPVALSANSRGDIYITDWVVRQYPVHGQGRIWRLTHKGSQPLLTKMEGNKETPEQDFIKRKLSSGQWDMLSEALSSEDVFVKTVVRKMLGDSAYHQEIMGLTESKDPAMRLQALLTLLKTKTTVPETTLQQLLKDENEEIRRMTLIYIATHAREDLYEEVTLALHKGQISPALFETYLATMRHLQPAFIQAFETRAVPSSKLLERKLPDAYIITLIEDKSLSPEIKAAALPYLEDPKSHLVYLAGLLKTSPKPLQAALLQIFKQLNDENAAATMLGMALDQKAESALRAQALVSLGYQSSNFCTEVSSLLLEENEFLVETALRYLCRCGNNETISEAVEEHVINEDALNLWQLCNSQPLESRPQTDMQWEEAIDGNGNAEKGQLVFQYVNAQCQRCHTIDGWGGHFGPDLSHIGSSKSKEQLITAILQPSTEISPEWQGWFVTTQEGQTHYGRQIDVGFDKVEIMLSSGEFVSFDTPKSYGMAPASLMPEGLENILTVAELNDLITYLMSLK